MASEEGAINVLPIGGAVSGKKEVYHVTKNPDGSFKVHSMSTNTTTNVATVCPTKKNETMKTCVVLTFDQDQSQVVSTKNVSFGESLGSGFNVVTVSDLSIPD